MKIKKVDDKENDESYKDVCEYYTIDNELCDSVKIFSQIQFLPSGSR